MKELSNKQKEIMIESRIECTYNVMLSSYLCRRSVLLLLCSALSNNNNNKNNNHNAAAFSKQVVLPLYHKHITLLSYHRDVDDL